MNIEHHVTHFKCWFKATNFIHSKTKFFTTFYYNHYCFSEKDEVKSSPANFLDVNNYTLFFLYFSSLTNTYFARTCWKMYISIYLPTAIVSFLLTHKKSPNSEMLWKICNIQLQYNQSKWSNRHRRSAFRWTRSSYCCESTNNASHNENERETQ